MKVTQSQKDTVVPVASRQRIFQGTLNERRGAGNKHSVGDQDDRARFRMPQSRIHVLHQVSPFTRGVRYQDCRSSLLGFWCFPITYTSHRFFTATLRFDDGNQIPTTEGTGRRSLHVESDHRCPESCEGDLERNTSQGCLWLRQHPSHHDSGKFPSLLR